MCPPITNITTAEIKKHSYSAFLSGRKVTNPAYYYKEDSCDLVVDVSKMKVDDFYFMIFRSNGPPIFNKRFIAKYPPAKTEKFTPTGLKCVKMGNEWQWQYFGGKIADVKFALQPNECGCTNSFFDLKQIYGACDQFQFTCNAEHFPYVGDFIKGGKQSFIGHVKNQELTDLTCVSGSWYFNSFFIVHANIRCGIASLFLPPSPKLRSDSFHCNCVPMDYFSVNVKPNDAFLGLLDPSRTMAGYTFSKDRSVTYNKNTCHATINCNVDETIVLFSDFEPLYFQHGELPNIICSASTLSRNANPNLRSYFWFVDGTQLSNPTFGCVPSCKCKFARLHPNNIERLVAKSSFYPLVKDRPYQPPVETRKKINECITTVSCPRTHTLIVFDSQLTTLYPTGSLTAKCGANGKWTVNNGADNGLFDQIYALCVDFND